MERHLGLVLGQIIVSWIIFSNLLRVNGEVIIDPPAGVRPDGDLVVDAGSTFTLTCRGDSPLAWTYNDYDANEKSEKEVMPRTEHGQEVSVLTVRNAYYLDTGYFICYPLSEGQASPQAQKLYIYVKDDSEPDRYLAVNDTFSILTVHQFGDVIIPCKPTDPDLSVELMKDDMVVPGAKYDPHVGFEFHIDKVHHSGQYLCVIGDNYIDFFVHVDIMSNKTSVERPHVHISPTPVVEGADVTFACEVHYDVGVKIKLSWSVPHAHLNQSDRINEEEDVEEEKMGEHVKNYKGHRTMTLTDVSKRDEGEYTCHVVDNSGNHNSKAVTLSVIPSGMHTLKLDVRGYANKSKIQVPPGQNEVHFLVDIVAHPPPKSIQWYDNYMKPIIGRGENYTVDNSDSLAKLTIHQPSVHNSGTYTLVVNNKAFNKSVSATLLVEGAPELIVNKDKEQAYYMVNKSYTVDCDVFALPEPNITWYFKPCPDYPICSSQFSMIPPSQYTEQEIATDNSSPFKSMVEIRAENTGMLECRACNSLGCASKDTMILLTDVENGLSIEKPELVVETDNVTLSCGASKFNYSKGLEWLKMEKNGIPSAVKDLDMLISETKYSYFNQLLIPKVGKNNSGVYICSAKLLYDRNQFHTQKFTLDVKDLEKPVIHKNVSTKALVRTGQPVKLYCHVQGSPPPTISWFMNGERILKGKHKNIELFENNQTLSIGGAGLEHKGRYECRASNKAGTDELIIDIEITDIKSMFVYVFLWYLLPLLLILLIVGGLFYWHYVRKYKRKIKELKELGLEYFENGKVESINPEIDISEQADLLPYDRQKWEFPRDKLKLGKTLGSGAFGVVLQAEAYELVEPGVATTVAVKMVKRNSDSATIRALASELKIMIHLGKHLNVVNVLGACTGDLNKRELLVLVEYCRYGNLRQYLLQHRGAFINQVNPQTGQFDSTFIEPMSPNSVSNRFSYSNGKAYDSAAFSQATDTTLVMSDMSVANNQTTPVGEDGYLISRDHEWRNQDRGEYKDPGLRPVFTQDLICWSFQIARGMEYLASRKVLHGDLAARNILLAEDNIVKICDFGLSKSVYKYSDYKKKGEGPLPIKWMALESIRDKVFSTQSDVWSYGITVWELFSLGCTPYPGMELDPLSHYQKLVGGYRMEKPKYATKQVFQVMMDCWHENPHSRPSFTELTERMGGMLEDTVRSHYVDLNDPYLQQNSEFLAQQDYLSMLQSPSYVNWNSGYTSMKPASPRGEVAMELTPMLSLNVKPGSESLKPASPQQVPPATDSDTHDGPEGSPIIRTKPKGNDYVNVTHVLGFSNPSYQNLGRPKKSPYMNVPHG